MSDQLVCDGSELLIRIGQGNEAGRTIVPKAGQMIGPSEELLSKCAAEIGYGRPEDEARIMKRHLRLGIRKKFTVEKRQRFRAHSRIIGEIVM